MKSGTRFRVPLFVGLLQCGRCDQRPLPTVDVAEPTTACCWISSSQEWWSIPALAGGGPVPNLRPVWCG